MHSGFFFRNARMFIALLLMDSSVTKNVTSISKLKLEAMGSGFLEAFLESAPQFVLQLYIILKTGRTSNIF